MNMSTTDRTARRQARTPTKTSRRLGERPVTPTAPSGLLGSGVRTDMRCLSIRTACHFVPRQAPNLRARIPRRDPWTFSDFRGDRRLRQDHPVESCGRVARGSRASRLDDPRARRNGARPASPPCPPPRARERRAGRRAAPHGRRPAAARPRADRAGPRRGHGRPVRPIYRLIARVPGRRPRTRRSGRRRASPPLVPSRSRPHVSFRLPRRNRARTRRAAGPGSRRLETLAIEAAAEVVCGPGFDPESPAARRVFRREHPDLMVVAPERRRRVNPPPFEETDGKETKLPTALVRAVAADATRFPYEAQRRAVVFLDVDRTESAAFSALLKILEEPPTKTRFILTATRPRLLPSTILSRVALRPVPGATREETAASLRGRGMREEEAEARAAFAPHDADEAAELDVAGARATRDALLEAISGVCLTRS